MGMSTRVEGIRAPDEKWKAMKAVWDACKAARVEPPENVSAFFNDERPDDAGVVVDLGGYGAQVAREYRKDESDGLEVDVSDLVAGGFTTVRFVNSW